MNYNEITFWSNCKDIITLSEEPIIFHIDNPENGYHIIDVKDNIPQKDIFIIKRLEYDKTKVHYCKLDINLGGKDVLSECFYGIIITEDLLKYCGFQIFEDNLRPNELVYKINLEGDYLFYNITSKTIWLRRFEKPESVEDEKLVYFLHELENYQRYMIGKSFLFNGLTC